MAPKLTIAAIREMTKDELVAKIAELEAERFGLRFKAGTEVLSNPMDLRTTRRQVARLKTVLTELERAGKDRNAVRHLSPKLLRRIARALLSCQGESTTADRHRRRIVEGGVNLRSAISAAPPSRVIVSVGRGRSPVCARLVAVASPGILERR